MPTNIKYFYMIPILLLLMSCGTTLPLNVQENKNIDFSPSQQIFITTDHEIVKLSTRLKRELINAGFKVTDRSEDAEYVLDFIYEANFDVYPWIFSLFNLKMTESDSGNVLYTVTADKSGSEPVNSVIKRAVDEMAHRLIENQKQSQIYLKVGETNN